MLCVSTLQAVEVAAAAQRDVANNCVYSSIRTSTVQVVDDLDEADDSDGDVEDLGGEPKSAAAVAFPTRVRSSSAVHVTLTRSDGHS